MKKWNKEIRGGGGGGGGRINFAKSENESKEDKGG